MWWAFGDSRCPSPVWIAATTLVSLVGSRRAIETRTTERNGTTAAGIDPGRDVGLKIPKLCQGSFSPLILECRRRIDQA